MKTIATRLYEPRDEDFTRRELLAQLLSELGGAASSVIFAMLIFYTFASH